MSSPGRRGGNIFTDIALIHGPCLEIEKMFTPDQYYYILSQYWVTPIIVVILYLTLIRLGTKWMEDRKPMQVKRLLFIWNSLLAFYSIWATYRLANSVTFHLRHKGIRAILCTLTTDDADNVSAFHAFLFVMSKILEMGDTLFLIVRKRQMLFLHWYHHATVLLLSWLSIVDLAPTSMVFATVNVAVHSFMYTYYALASIGYRIPKRISIGITVMQISQMVIGIVAQSASFYTSQVDSTCRCPSKTLIAAFTIYGSYFALFVHFFVHRYVFSSKPPAVLVVKKITDQNANKAD